MLGLGTRIGSYEIVEAIGAGGMGEIYRARDTRLGRDVAIKALPEAFSEHADRLDRFEREAKMLASLNHANIGTIYGLEDANGHSYLVLELVEGESLADRLARGSLDVRETLEIGAQVAAAIEAAHERGIVHRDLKPGNVMITPARIVKVLDFGLAKDIDEASPNAPTLARSATADGLILGTAPYMSPEQARGKTIDRRTDVWAFGCLIYECLAGHQAFAGETVSDVIVQVLEHEPAWDDLPASAPPRLQDLIRRCLTKDAEARPRDIGDLRREIQSIAMDFSSPGRVAARGQAVPSLAVLYFENLANDPESEYFCAGITEDILTDLSKIKGLRVASRNAVLRYKGGPADIPRVAAELGVGTILEGSVRRAGDRVRISTQLIKADGFHLWAERYDRTLADVFAVQEEIAHAIAEALRITLSPQEAQNLVQGRPQDVRAYDLYLKGRQKYFQYTRESLAEALELFRKAIEVESNYALAWAGLADTYTQQVQYAFASDRAENLRLASEAAQRAIALEPRLAEGYKALAFVMGIQGDRPGARATLLKAVEINPRLTSALINLGVQDYIEGNLAAAERYIRRAIEVDPMEPFARLWLTTLFRITGRIDELESMANHMKDNTAISPFYLSSYYYVRAMAHFARNEAAQAERVVDEGVAAGVPEQNMRGLQAYVAAWHGRAEEARNILRGLTIAGMGMSTLTVLAEAAVRAGDLMLAKDLVNRPSIGDSLMTTLRVLPALHPMLDLPIFAPRRWDHTLVWPVEGAMPHPSILPLFRDVRLESGLPQASEVAV